MTLTNWIMLSPPCFLIISSLVPLLVKAFRTKNIDFSDRDINDIGEIIPENEFRPQFIQSYFVILAGFATALSGLLFRVVLNKDPYIMFEGQLSFEPWSVAFSGLLFLSFFVALFFMTQRGHFQWALYTESLFLITQGVVGAWFILFANHLIVAFIALEMMSLCLYLAIGLGRRKKESSESSFKYFIMGSVASCILLLGMGFLYGGAGDLALDKLMLSTELSTASFVLFGWVLFFVGILFKVSIAPFHFWTPDVYEGAATPLTGFMSVFVKISCFGLLFRVLTSNELLEFNAFFVVLSWLAVLTMLLGNIGAFVQFRNLKRVLAYSSIAHSGYILAGLMGVVFMATKNPELNWFYKPLLLYIFAYTFGGLGIFGLLVFIENRTGWKLTNFEGLRGLRKKGYGGLILVMSIFLLSLAGIPPLLGFFAKAVIFLALVKSGLFWLCFWFVIGSAISLYYYVKPIIMALFDEPTELTMDLRKVSRRSYLMEKIGLFFCILFCVLGPVLLGFMF